MSNEVPSGHNESTAERASQVATASREEAAGVAQAAASEARGVARDAHSQAQHVAEAAVDRAQDVLADVRGELRQRADEQGDRAARALHDASDQLHNMAQAAGGGVLTDLAQTAASRVDGVASRLDRGGVDDILGELRSYARRRPGMFLLAAGVAGFVVGRLARNASPTMSRTAQPPAMTPPASTPVGSAPLPAVEGDFVVGASSTWGQP